jgi:hypothetical protein
MSAARWLWLAVPLAGLVELGLHHHFANAAPRPGEWQTTRAHVSRLRQHGELVVVAPHWAEPWARQTLGDELMPLRDLARPDESAYSRAIEISILDQRAAELAGWRVVTEERHGKFTFRVLENPEPASVKYDFVDHVDPASLEVFELGSGEPRPCPWRTDAPVSNGALGGNPTFPRQRFQCPSGEWFFAGVTVIDDQHEYRPRRCIWSHPPPSGRMLLRFKNVPLGATLRGYAGLPWLIFRDPQGAPVELELRARGTVLGVNVHEDAQGWAGFSFPTRAAGESADVELEVRTRDAKDRHYCFALDSR